MNGGRKTNKLKYGVAFFRVLVKSLFQYAAKVVPNFREFILVIFRELNQLLQNPIGDGLFYRGEDGAFLNCFARNIERKIGRINHEANKSHPPRRDLGIHFDEDVLNVELGPAWAAGIEQIERPRTRHKRQDNIVVTP